MGKDEDGKRQLTCPTCSVPVVYDPADPMHTTTGALLRNANKKAAVIYLTCSKGHLERYELT